MKKMIILIIFFLILLLPINIKAMEKKQVISSSINMNIVNIDRNSFKEVNKFSNIVAKVKDMKKKKKKNEEANDITKEDMEEWLNDYDKKNIKCNTILGNPKDKDSVAWLLQQILNYLKVIGPMVVIVMSAMDFSKAIIQSDDEIMQKAQKKLILRLVLTVALFFIPTLVTVLLGIFGLTDDPICSLK